MANTRVSVHIENDKVIVKYDGEQIQELNRQEAIEAGGEIADAGRQIGREDSVLKSDEDDNDATEVSESSTHKSEFPTERELSSMNAGEQAATLVHTPELYADLKSLYGSEFKYFRRLRNSAPSDLSFDEYVELHRIFLEHDRKGGVQKFIEDTLHRSLRNMITRRSSRGRAYAVESLSELEDCRLQFDTLPVETPSLETVIDTLLESLYDDGWSQTIEILEWLLEDTTGCPEPLVNYLVRVYVTALLDQEEDLSLARDVYRSLSTAEIDDAPMTAGGCLDAAENVQYEDTKRTDFIQTAVHRGGADPAAFVDFLCESAIDDIEIARHDSGQSEQPSRGELGFAMFQLAAVENCEAAELNAEEKTWLQAYRRVTGALVASEGYWISHRDTPPEPDFSQAVTDYTSAARLLEGIHLKRSLTYLSKSYRMLAHTATTPIQTREIHEECINALIICAEENSDTDDRVVNTRLTSLVQFHRLEVLKIRVIQAYRDRRYNTVLSLFNECESICENCDHPAAALTDVQTVTDIARGVAAEHRGEFKLAAIQFEAARENVDHSPVDFNQSDFADRANISGFKSHVVDDEYEMARGCLNSCTLDCKLLSAALDCLVNDSIDSIGDGNIDRLPGINSGAIQCLRHSVEMHVSDSQTPDAKIIHAIDRI